MRRAGLLVCLLLASAAGAARGQADPAEIGVRARLKYTLALDDESTPFPYNAATRSAYDLTRIMLDFRALDTRYGSFYVKGRALWDSFRPTVIQRRFHLWQGDYLWQDDVKNLWYSFRIFANERRYITYDMIAPLLVDDVVTDGNRTRGVRLDGTVADKVDVTAIYATLQATLDKWRDIAYLRGAYFLGSAMMSLSYLYEDGVVATSSNHAVAKAEASMSYKQLFVTASYEQSEFSDARVFWPNGSWDNGNPANAFPDNAAVFAEARLTSVNLRDWGRVRLVWKYVYAGEDFSNDLGRSANGWVGQAGGLYYMGRRQSLFGRLFYSSGERIGLESEDAWFVAADAWGDLANGFDFLFRSRVGENRDQYNEEGNFIHVATHHRSNQTMTGAHVLWSDLNTPYSETAFAVDGRIAISPSWALYWRFMAGYDFDVSANPYARLEYRPNNHLWATLAFGRPIIGDDPFLLEDRQFGLGRSDAPLFTLLLRGDLF